MHRFLLALPAALLLGMKTGDGVHQQPQPAAPVVAARAADNGAALPTQAEMERLAKANFLSLFEAALKRYDREVKGYSATFQKQDRIGGRLYPNEVVTIHFRDKPHSVYMAWQEGTRKAERVIFVEGENDNQMLIRPAGRVARLVAGDVVTRAVDGSDAKAAGRYTLRQFGLKRSMERTWKEWRETQEAGNLKVEFLGVKRLKEAGDRPCWTWRRLLKKPDANGIAEAVISVDTENWLQVGTVLKDERGNLLGAYYFRDLKLNPEFKKDQFQRAALTP